MVTEFSYFSLCTNHNGFEMKMWFEVPIFSFNSRGLTKMDYLGITNIFHSPSIFTCSNIIGQLTEKQFHGQLYPVFSLFYKSLRRYKAWNWFQVLNLHLVCGIFEYLVWWAVDASEGSHYWSKKNPKLNKYIRELAGPLQVAKSTILDICIKNVLTSSGTQNAWKAVDEGRILSENPIYNI